jgi:hypothetical protein
VKEAKQNRRKRNGGSRRSEETKYDTTMLDVVNDITNKFQQVFQEFDINEPVQAIFSRVG